MNKILNWKRSPKDERDFKYSSKFLSNQSFPESVILTELSSEVYDQGNTGSCTGQSSAMQLLTLSRTKGLNFFPSRLFLYYGARELEDSTNEDIGAYIRDIYKAFNKQGVCTELLWPFKENTVTTKPNTTAYTDALKTKPLKYYSLNGKDINELKHCLSSGRTFVFGFDVYESFMSNSWKSIMPIPKSKERILGGHAICVFGYSDSKQAFLIKNSWGSEWKDGGYFWMPYSYITSDSCDDFWTVEDISFNEQPIVTETTDLSKIFVDRSDLIIKTSVLKRIAKMLNIIIPKTKTELIDLIYLKINN